MPVPIVFTDELDSAEPVLAELRNRDVSPFVVSASALTSLQNGLGVVSAADASYAELFCSDQTVRMDGSTRIWRWKARTLGPDSVLDADSTVNDMKISQYRSALRSLWEVPASWMNKFSSEIRLEQNKSLAADVARRCGLSVPDTLITDNPATFSAFVQNNAHDSFAVKAPAAWGAAVDSGVTLGSYTTRLDRKTALQLAPSVAYAPIILQPYIEKAFELRVTCVGKEIFCCRIDSQSSRETQVDWRLYPETPVPHTVAELPSSLQRKLRTFMNACDLVYATLDLIVTPNDDLVFLEANPSGQYLWIQQMTQLPITQAIANWLCEPHAALGNTSSASAQ